MGKLVKAYEVIRLTLILLSVCCVLQGAKNNLRSGREIPGMGCRIISRFREKLFVILPAFINQFAQLRISLSDDDPFVVRDVDLP